MKYKTLKVSSVYYELVNAAASEREMSIRRMTDKLISYGLHTMRKGSLEPPVPEITGRQPAPPKGIMARLLRFFRRNM